MKPIYEPKGKAKEYGDYAINIYTGCPHRCYYCFAPNVLHKVKDDFHSHIEPRKNIVEEVRKQIWNGERHEVKTDCKVNTETFEVFDIEEPPRIVKEMLDDATLDGEYIGFDGVRYPVVRKEQLPDGDITSFWRK